MMLVPGGRWLLALGTRTGCIFYYDLDSPAMEQRLLIDTEKLEPIEIMKNFVYWIDTSQPKLSFRVAMWCPYHLRGMSVRSNILHVSNILEDIPFIRTYVYQVDLVGHGGDASLEARKIVVLRDYRDRTKGSTAVLTDKYLIEFWFQGDRDTGFFLSRYNTEVDEGVQSNRIRVPFAQRTIVVSLLPTHKPDIHIHHPRHKNRMLPVLIRMIKSSSTQRTPSKYTPSNKLKLMTWNWVYHHCVDTHFLTRGVEQTRSPIKVLLGLYSSLTSLVTYACSEYPQLMMLNLSLISKLET